MRLTPVMPEPTVGPTLDGSLRPRPVTEAVPGYSSVGCFNDFSEDRFLNGTNTSFGTNYTQLCCDWCVNMKTEFTICGVEYETECFCDSTTSNAKPALASACSNMCPGEGTRKCGGTWNMNLYSGISFTTTAATYTSLTKQEVSEFSNLGCFSDYNNSRLLQGVSMVGALLNDPTYCCEWRAGVDHDNQWCGVEYGTECFCDSTTPDTSSAATMDCSMLCPGAPAYQCGGGYCINLYTFTGVKPTAATATLAPASVSTLPRETGARAQTHGHDGLSGGAIGGVAVSVVAAVSMVGLLLFFSTRRRRSGARSESLTSTTAPLTKSPVIKPPLEMPTRDNRHELQSQTGAPYIEPTRDTGCDRGIYEMEANR